MKYYRRSFLKDLIVYLIPIIIAFDWMVEFQWIGLKIGLYLKGFLTVIFFNKIILSRVKGFHFKKTIYFFLIVVLFYAILSSNLVENLYLSIRIGFWVFGTVVIYYLIIVGKFSNEDLKKLLFLTTLTASIFTIVLMFRSEEHQNASAYLLLWCFPLLIYFRQDTRIKIVLILSIFAILITIKRGAILAMLFSTMAYFFIYFRKSKGINHKLRVFFGVALFIALAGTTIFNKWDSYSSRLEDTGGSGRDVMYVLIIQDYMSSNLKELVFGRGINSVQELTAKKLAGNSNSEGVAAHSDWLQNLYDFGVFGFIFMVALHIGFLKLIRVNKVFQLDTYPIVIMAYVIFSLTTIYSFILSKPDAIFMGLVLAFIAAKNNLTINSLKTEKYKLLNGKIKINY